MTDPERALRRQVLDALAGAGELIELSWARAADGDRLQPDVLCRPSAPDLAGVSIVIETKLRPVIADRDLAPWIKQAADYVGAEPDNGWPRVVAAFVWIGDQVLLERELDRMVGMLQLAQHFRVGQGWMDGKRGTRLMFGRGTDLYSSARGWRPRAAEYLMARRVHAGTRRAL